MQKRSILVLLMALALVSPAAIVTAQDDTPAEGPGLTEAPTADGETPQEPAAENGDGEEGENEGSPVAEQQPPNFWGEYGLFIVLFGAIILMYVWMGRSRRKQEQQRKEMLSSLTKGDKITTIGGIQGTVMDVREDEVTVKVDEQNNIKMKFARAAVQNVGERKGGATQEEKK